MEVTVMNPYSEKGDKKEQVQAMFDSIAGRYDLLNHVLSLGIDRGWRRKLEWGVCSAGAQNILDVATGTGDLALLLAQKCPGSKITGIDLSEGMLAIGTEKVNRKGLSDRITMMTGDAEALVFENDAFDAVTAAFGVRNFGNIEQGLAEFYRVLQPGGTVWILEFGLPKHKIFGAIYRFYFHKVLPTIGKMISRDQKAYRYLPQSVDSFPYGKAFVGLLEQTGFRQCRVRNLFGGVAQIYYGEK